MNLSITGGTGFVGREVIRELLGSGHRVRIVTRARAKPGSRSSSSSAEVLYSGADFGSAERLAEAFSGTAAVIHLVGIISEAGAQTFERVHGELTGVVLEAARLAGVRRFVHMSALGTRPEAQARYHRTKWEAEERVRASGLDWTIFRPSLIYGARDGFTRLFARLSAWSPVLPVMGSGDGLLQPVAVEQVARAMARAPGLPSSIGRTYELCGPERVSFTAVLRAILAAHGRRRLLMRIPMPVARFQARVLEWVFPLVLRRPPPLNRDQLVMLGEDNVGDGSEADAAFGLEHQPFGDAMRRLAAREFEALAAG